MSQYTAPRESGKVTTRSGGKVPHAVIEHAQYLERSRDKNGMVPAEATFPEVCPSGTAISCLRAISSIRSQRTTCSQSPGWRRSRRTTCSTSLWSSAGISTSDSTSSSTSGKATVPRCGSAGSIRRQSADCNVVAIVVAPYSVAERKTVSREVGCLDKLEALNIALGRTADRLRREGTDWVQQVRRSSEYGAIEKVLLDAFVWQVGHYTVRCAVTVAGVKHSAECEFRFVLGEGAFAQLKSNVATIESNFFDGLKGETRKPTPLHWAYPYALTASNASVPTVAVSP
jgi:hypothetical protein